MKKYLISTVVIVMALVVAWPVLGQREGGEAREGRRRFQDMSEEERARMRERFQNMSEEEREKFRAEMREKLGSRPPFVGREEQLKAVKYPGRSLLIAAGPGTGKTRTLTSRIAHLINEKKVSPANL